MPQKQSASFSRILLLLLPRWLLITNLSSSSFKRLMRWSRCWRKFFNRPLPRLFLLAMSFSRIQANSYTISISQCKSSLFFFFSSKALDTSGESPLRAIVVCVCAAHRQQTLNALSEIFIRNQKSLGMMSALPSKT